jgi:hypothetical protein
MWCVLFGGGGEDVLIPIEDYSVYKGTLKPEAFTSSCLHPCS